MTKTTLFRDVIDFLNEDEVADPHADDVDAIQNIVDSEFARNGVNLLFYDSQDKDALQEAIDCIHLIKTDDLDSLYKLASKLNIKPTYVFSFSPQYRSYRSLISNEYHKKKLDRLVEKYNLASRGFGIDEYFETNTIEPTVLFAVPSQILRKENPLELRIESEEFAINFKEDSVVAIVNKDISDAEVIRLGLVFKELYGR